MGLPSSRHFTICNSQFSIFNWRKLRTILGRGFSRTADYQSATQQSATLRYARLSFIVHPSTLYVRPSSFPSKTQYIAVAVENLEGTKAVVGICKGLVKAHVLLVQF